MEGKKEKRGSSSSSVIFFQGLKKEDEDDKEESEAEEGTHHHHHKKRKQEKKKNEEEEEERSCLKGKKRGVTKEDEDDEQEDDEQQTQQQQPQSSVNMVNNVPKTIQNPLFRLSRREFKKFSEQGTTIFNGFRSIDDNVNRIVEALCHIVDDTYESYWSAFKKMKNLQEHRSSSSCHEQQSSSSANMVDAAGLTSVLADARKTKENEQNLRAQYVLLETTYKRQMDLYTQLHSCSQAVVEDCMHNGGTISMTKSIAMQTLSAILKKCPPDREARHYCDDDDGNNDEQVIDRIADQVADLQLVSAQYKMMLAEIDRLYAQIRELKASEKRKNISNPFLGPAVVAAPVGNPTSSAPVESKRKKRS